MKLTPHCAHMRKDCHDLSIINVLRHSEAHWVSIDHRTESGGGQGPWDFVAVHIEQVTSVLANAGPVDIVSIDKSAQMLVGMQRITTLPQLEY